jgi:hypothetical protein
VKNVFKRRLALVKANMKLIRNFQSQILLGGNGEEEIPDPIPNSEVKLLIADGTIHKSMEE